MPVRRTTSPGFNDDRYRAVIVTLLERRKQLGISQQSLAERLGLHKQFVSRVELGERRLDFVEFADFVRALGLEPDVLIASVPLPPRRADEG
ncbi:helix-turn-helix domain-containing protein [Sphingomonas psychrotolerans]|uniref:XRE family transcriptional regulator n=1 Tax=Sphingomonas psychrotolerans TaxID=1327635 RepID=A0A2K8MA86_9SPHN|nr:XRE family transcriptional regulator [Sphingomonas psychrotolerans]